MQDCSSAAFVKRRDEGVPPYRRLRRESDKNLFPRGISPLRSDFVLTPVEMTL